EVQWLKEAVPLANGDSTELLLENINVEDGGIYSAIVTNRAGTIKSEPTVIEILPMITYQPESQYFSTFGGTAIFDVRAIGTPPLTYRWLKDGKLLLETDEPRLVIDRVSGEDGGEYRVVVANQAGQAMSESVSLLVPPFISQHPHSKIVRAGDDVEFTVQAVGKEPFEYQWMKNGQIIPGETEASLQLQNVEGDDSARYTVKVTNEVGEVTSEDALLSISPQIITAPEAKTAAIGSNITFSVEAEGTRPLHYQWTKDGNTLGNRNDATLTLTGIKPEDAGAYSVIISNAAGIAISESVSLEVE
ncbi:MAG TPA: immunoglobulin domain-containing protein, partial [Opitutales bacterium]|nr:immunoglobulin domain-containing protein [Opitutales bacterium]